MKLKWTAIPRAIRAQYNVAGTNAYAQLEGITLAGDDMELVVTADIIVGHDAMLVSFYRYSDNVFEDFQLTFSMPVDGITKGQARAEDVLQSSMSLRYLAQVGLTAE